MFRTLDSRPMDLPQHSPWGNCISYGSLQECTLRSTNIQLGISFLRLLTSWNFRGRSLKLSEPFSYLVKQEWCGWDRDMVPEWRKDWNKTWLDSKGLCYKWSYWACYKVCQNFVTIHKFICYLHSSLRCNQSIY